MDIAAVCDANTAKIDSAKRWTPQATGYDDFRKLLADKSIDAVIIATPDPWHAQMMILACEAGKDVYLEKPVMYRLAEAKAMREVVRRTKRIVQIGSQHRSADHIVEAGKMVQSGKIGEVKFVRVWNYQIEPAAAPVPDSDPPAGMNWDAWLGPSPKVPYNVSRLYYRAFMDYTNGLISDYGNHRFDSVHMVMGEEKPLQSLLLDGHAQPQEGGGHRRLPAGHLRVSGFHHGLRGVCIQQPRPGRQNGGHALLQGAGDRRPPARHGLLRNRGGPFRGPHRDGAVPGDPGAAAVAEWAAAGRRRNRSSACT